MTFKARVLSALAAVCVSTVVGSVILARLNAPDAYDQALIAVVGLSGALYVVWAILRERNELDRQGR